MRTFSETHCISCQVFTAVIEQLLVFYRCLRRLLAECSEVSKEITASIFKVKKSVSSVCLSSLDYRNFSVTRQVCLPSPISVLAAKRVVSKTLNAHCFSKSPILSPPLKELNYPNFVHLSHTTCYRPSTGCVETISGIMTRVCLASQVAFKKLQ